MCSYWGITPWTYARRINKGWTLEKALTEPLCEMTQRAAKPCTDHLGNKFDSVTDMCRYHGVAISTFGNRRLKGASLEQALRHGTVFSNTDKYSDHLGNRFNSLRSMASYWNLSYQVLQNRLNSGWGLKASLETPVRAKHSSSVI